MGFLLLQTGGTDNLLLQNADDLLLQADDGGAARVRRLLLLGVGVSIFLSVVLCP